MPRRYTGKITVRITEQTRKKWGLLYNRRTATISLTSYNNYDPHSGSNHFEYTLHDIKVVKTED